MPEFDLVRIQGEELATAIFDGGSNLGEVILIHGFTGSKEDFTEIAINLAEKGYRVLTFDNRGQNESAHSTREDAYLINSLARDVSGLADYFKMSHPHLLGHSFGGLIAQQVAISYPGKWSSLTLMCSGPGGKGGWFTDPAFENLGKVPSPELWEQYLDNGRKSHRYYEIHKRRWALSDPVSTLAMREQLFSQTPQLDKVASTRIRAHVIFGEKDDAWPIQDQLEMAEKISAEVTILAGCGHCPNEDDPELTSDQLMKFWSTLD